MLKNLFTHSFCIGLPIRLNKQTNCAYITLCTVHVTQHTIKTLASSFRSNEREKRKQKIDYNFNFNYIAFGVENLIYTQLWFMLWQSCLSNKQTRNCTYITVYTVHSTLCTIQIRVQYSRNKQRERTYGRNAFVTIQQAWFDFYLR